MQWDDIERWECILCGREVSRTHSARRHVGLLGLTCWGTVRPRTRKVITVRPVTRPIAGEVKVPRDKPKSTEQKMQPNVPKTGPSRKSRQGQNADKGTVQYENGGRLVMPMDVEPIREKNSDHGKPAFDW